MTEAARPAGAGLVALLGRHPGSVTDLLERLAGEPVDADIQAQSLGPTPDAGALGLDADTDMLRRAVLLRGRVTGRNYVYAETSFAPARVPPSVRRRLEQTRDPIGRVLSDHRLAVGREPLPGRAMPSYADASTEILLTAAVLSRRYRILLGTIPAFVVDEWFLDTVAEALVDHPDVYPDV